MARRALPLYVSATSWVAPAPVGKLEPLAGEHIEIAQIDWAGVGRRLYERFGHAQVHLLLSARQCRFQVLPWISSLYTSAAIRGYVADAFAEAVGVTAESHHIEIDWPRFGEPIVAAAYPMAVVEAARAGLRADGHTLACVDSSIGVVLQRFGDVVEQATTLLAYAEDDGVTGLTLEQGQLVQIESLGAGSIGLDDIRVWSLRKQFSLGDGAQLRWLGTVAPPDGFEGVSLAVPGATQVSAGLGVLQAWQ